MFRLWKKRTFSNQCKSRKNENDEQDEDESKPPAKKTITTKLKWGPDVRKVSMLNAGNEKCENYSNFSQLKFILDNASLVNICNDLSAFIRMTSTTRIRWYRSGSAIERATGQIAIAVKDSNSGQFSRIELDSIYDPSADVNLLSQDKLMKDFGMAMSITLNNLKCWMKNSQISIQFDKVNGFYAANSI